MRKRRKHVLLLMLCITGMMLSLCGCGNTRARETGELLEALSMSTADHPVMKDSAFQHNTGCRDTD